MKKWTILTITAMIAGMFIVSCSDDEDNTTNPDATAPTVNITYPANNAEFTEGDQVTIKADATDNKAVEKVEFYINGDLVGTSTESPYEYVLDTKDKVGTHTIMAKAQDTSGNVGSSSVINFSVVVISNMTKVYYLSDASGTYNLWRGDYNSSGLTNTTQLTSYDNHYIKEYAISTSSNQIAFTLVPNGDHRGDIYIDNLDLQNPQLIPNQPSAKAANGLSFSPNGSKLVFSLGADSQYDVDLIVATINVDGSDYQQIISTNEPRGTATHKLSLNWTDNGLLISDTKQWSAYTTQFEIFLYDFSTFSNLTNTSTVGERYPFVSPNGQKIVYGTGQNGSPNPYGIGLMDIDGLNQTDIISLTPDVGYEPGGWLDDNIVIYNSSIDGTYDIWQMNCDGTNKIKLTNIGDSNQRKSKIVVLSRL